MQNQEKLKKTNFIEVESICIIDNNATIAANILLFGYNYSEPIYTNIFCSKEFLIDLLLNELKFPT